MAAAPPDPGVGRKFAKDKENKYGKNLGDKNDARTQGETIKFALGPAWAPSPNKPLTLRALGHLFSSVILQITVTRKKLSKSRLCCILAPILLRLRTTTVQAALQNSTQTRKNFSAWFARNPALREIRGETLHGIKCTEKRAILPHITEDREMKNIMFTHCAALQAVH